MKVVLTRTFDRDTRRMGATDTDIAALVEDLIADPLGGDVIKGLGGARKLRFALKSRNIGKRGGARAIYLAVEADEAIFLLMAYAKNEKSDLSPADRKVIKAVIAAILES